jgi:hypothetical protein
MRKMSGLEGEKKGNSVEAAWKLKSSLLGVGLCKK